ncbi:MAG: hypothetical protein KDJ99_00365 [Candidatus Competibacteraceae bacterium]|nr:hypothetical protein [Candidatus Competibacteraceae bacterium]
MNQELHELFKQLVDAAGKATGMQLDDDVIERVAARTQGHMHNLIADELDAAAGVERPGPRVVPLNDSDT